MTPKKLYFLRITHDHRVMIRNFIILTIIIREINRLSPKVYTIAQQLFYSYLSWEHRSS